jgi:hypothetical protein
MQKVESSRELNSSRDWEITQSLTTLRAAPWSACA